LVPAESGGETPIADMRRVSAAIGPALLDKFEVNRVRYVRHYRPRVDLAWETVFQTADRQQLAQFCTDNDIVHEWLDKETLRTVQVCQGTAYHPDTGERVFFNQAHLFHRSSLGAAASKAMTDAFGHDRLPRNAYFGDGSELQAEDLEHIRAAYRTEASSFKWRSGDVLLLDNMQVAHGRMPFKGKRRVLAALLDPVPAPGGNTSQFGVRR